jgi:hypothetical protein
MSKTIKLKTADDVVLHKMSEEAIREMVIKQADEMLKSLPKELRVSQVNSVQLESNLKQVADIGGWAQWTRACCDRRRLIEDFEDPLIDELRIETTGVEKALFQNHFDSNFSIRKVTEPESLKKIKAGKNK